MTQFTYVELFAGIGGVSFGFDANGGRCVMASEIDKYPTQAYKALHPDVDLRGDVTKIEADVVPDHDVLSFTSPCQSFSVAGKRRGFEDTRGTLTFEALRIAKGKRPKVLFMENVKGLVNHDSGNTLDTIIHAMNEIGYTVDFTILNSKYFGVPQSRERLFIIALRNDLVTPEPWIIEGTTIIPKAKQRLLDQDVRTFNFDWPEQSEVSSKLRDVLEKEVDEKYYLSDDKTASLVAQLEDSGEPNTNKDMKMVGHANIDGHDFNRRIYSVDGVSRSLNTASDIGRSVKIAEPVIIHNIYGGFKESKPRIFENYSPTIRTSAEGGHLPSLLERYPKYRIRKLTPLECWRLQGFTDAQHQTVVDAGLSDSQRYKQAGNAVTVNVIQAIGERLLTHL